MFGVSIHASLACNLTLLNVASRDLQLNFILACSRKKTRDLKSFFFGSDHGRERFHDFGGG